MLDASFLQEGQNVNEEGLGNLEPFPGKYLEDIVQERHILHGALWNHFPIFDGKIFLRSLFICIFGITIHPADPDISIIAKDDASSWVFLARSIDCQKMMLLFFYEFMGNF